MSTVAASSPSHRRSPTPPPPASPPLELELEHAGRLDVAMQQNAVPLVRTLRVRNVGDDVLEDVVVTAWLEPDLEAARWQGVIERLEPGQSWHLESIDLPLPAGYLLGVREPQAARLVVRWACAAGQGESAERIVIDPVERWSMMGLVPELLAAYVLPGDPVVARLVDPALAALGHQGPPGYASGDPALVSQLVEALVEPLRGLGLAPEAEPVRYDARESLVVRLPERLLAAGTASSLEVVLLGAACLERAGLYPLVVVLRERVLLGVWTAPRSFPEPAPAELVRLRRRVEIEELELLDLAAAVTSKASLATARDAATRLSTGEGARLVYAVDVHCARNFRVRPLSGSFDTVSAAPPPPVVAPAPAPAASGASDPARERLASWKASLLDLSLRNRLLNFRDSGRTIPIAGANLAALEDRLVAAGRLELCPRVELMGKHDPRSAEVYAARTGRDPHAELLDAALADGRLHSTLTEAELTRRLVALAREARTSQEESGANTLYLALGLLRWTETPSATTTRLAPLLLVPVELARRSRRDPWALVALDEETRVNVTLLEKLRREHGIEVPELGGELPTDDHGVDVAACLRAMRRAIVDLERWEVLDEAHLGLFAFTRFLMWRDLEERSDALIKNHAVHRLVHGAALAANTDLGLTDQLPAVLPDASSLDRRFAPGDLYCPLDSDSTQLAAVVAAHQGASFVLEGPPGTGKSQTITNLIAHCLAAGKTVLFVAEKLAALEVVRHRLERIGLGDFCLELHSHKARKSEVVESLARTLEATRAAMPADWEARAAALRERRDALEAQVAALHAPTALGPSLFELAARLAVLRDTPQLPGLRADALDAARLAALEDTLEALAAAVTALACEPAAYPFAAVRDATWSAARQRSLDATAATLGDALSAFEDAWQASSKALELHSLCPPTPDGAALGTTLRLLEMLQRPPAAVPHGLASALASDLDAVHAARTLLETTLARVDARAALRAALGTHDPAEKLEAIARRRALADDLLPALADAPHDDAPALPQPLAAALDDIRATSAELARIAEQQPGLLGPIALEQLSASRLELFDALLAHAARPPSPPTVSFLAVAHWPETRARITGWLADAERQAALQSTLEARFEPALYTLDLEALAARYQRWATSFVLIAWLMLFSARRTLAGIARQPLPPAPEVRDALRDALTVRDLRRALPADTGPQRELLGSLWQGTRTDRAAVDALLAFGDEYHALLQGLVEPLAESERDAVRRALAERVAAGLRHTELGRWHEALRAALPRLRQASASLEQALGLDAGALAGERSGWPARLAALTALLPADAARLEQLGAIERELAADGESAAAQALGPWWQALVAAPDATAWHEHGAWLDGICSALAALGEGVRLSAPLASLAEGSGAEAVRAAARAPGTALEALEAARTALFAGFELEPPAQPLVAADTAPALPALRAHVDSLRQAASRFRSFAALRELWQRMTGEGLAPLVEAHRQGQLETAQLRDVLSASLLGPWLEQTLAAHPLLKDFRGVEHDRLAADFARRDRELVALSGQVVAAKLAQRLPPPDGAAASPSSEVGILRREAGKKRGHMPVRQLFRSMPDLVQRLKPCVMMSPLSVAQYLEADPRLFDLVVFDEASQIAVPDAIGAMARGKQVVVVGDTRQLPPTTFFGKTGGASDDELEDEADFVELDSVLDECVAAQLPRLRLGWHYRSRHENLIAFSNAHYYENRLHTFPCASPGAPGLGLRLVPVPDGVYERGGKRHNLAEARAVVAEVARRLRDPHERTRSLGIVTFSIPQQALIEELLDEARSRDSELDLAISAMATSGERLFIENLENVQGDERDVIIFSICYGPDRDGHVAMNFGPLNRDGGERRLNVAVTRAREELVVFSTLEPTHIDLSRTRAVGVAHLKRFLEFARGGPQALAEQLPAPLAGPDERRLVDDLASTLEARGWRTARAVGCSDFRVDLALEDPQRPGHFVLGLLLDGAGWRAAATVRDRERLRPSMLATLGWRIERIYALDLLQTRAQELARIPAPGSLPPLPPEPEPEPDPAPDDTQNGPPRNIPAPLPDGSPPVADRTAPRLPEPVVDAALGAEAPRMAEELEVAAHGVAEVVLEVFDPAPDPSLTAEDFYDVSARPAIRALVAQLVAREAPLSLAEAARRVATVWNVPRATKKVREHLLGTLLDAPSPVARLVDDFLWAPGQDPSTYRHVRVPAAGTKPRAIEDIPGIEQENAARLVLERNIALPREALVREAARLLGYSRPGKQVSEALDAAVERLAAQGLAILDGEKVRRADGREG